MDEKPIMLYTDSESAQQTVIFGGNHTRTKHTYCKYHFVREVLKQKSIILEYLYLKK